MGGGLYNRLYSGYSSTATLTSTIVAGNTTLPNGGGSPSDIGGSGSASVSGSYNLIGTGGSGGLTNGVNNNQVGVANPGLDPKGLQSNGGPTQTIALLPGSPAIDAGNNAAVADPPFPGPPFTDQRGAGFLRISGGAVDIGAFEVQQPPLSPTTLSPSVVGAPYSQTITATPTVDAAGPFTFAITTGALPGGLTLTSGGALSGTPTAAGTFNFTVTATASNGYTGPQAYTFVVSPATPSITTTPQPASATVGASIADKATVSGGDNPTGTVTFKLYSNSSGTGTPLFTDTETLSGGTATSKSYTATAVGTDYWVATYNGDSNNNPVSSGTASEPVTITPASPSISTIQQSASATVGSSIADQATVNGGFNPTGTVTFNLYNNPNGTGTPLFSDTETLGTGGMATSNLYTTTAAGTDYWVATYSGDSNNASVTSVSSAEPVTINPASPMISTSQLPTSATVGSSIADQATVIGGYNPTGTVTFNLYNNPNGTGTPLFADTEPLSGGTATSKGYTATAVGTDYWVATYNGDSNNNPVSSGAASEPVTIIATASPVINTAQQQHSATVGSSIADKATVIGGDKPTGTVTFNLYSNSSGTGTPLFTDTKKLSGSTATSKGYIATAAGTDYWVVTYSGDSNNKSATSGTTAEPVTITPRTG